jgi:hypothetical protein
MWHHNPKNPLVVNKPKAPAKPAALNASAEEEPKSSSSSLKFSTPEIRVGLNSAKSSMPTSVKVPKVSTPKMPKDKNVIIPKPKKMPKRKLA